MLDKIEKLLMALLMLGALGLVCTEVVLRYFFPRYLQDWGLEFTVYFTVWAVLLAGGALIREGRHVRADVLLHALPTGGQRWLEVVALVVAAVFAGALTYFGIQMVWLAYTLGEHSESSARFPLWLYYLSLPVGAALMTFEILRRLRRYVFQYDAHAMSITAEDVMRDK